VGATPLTLIVVVTSGPSSVWPKKAYRNPTDQLVKFLDRKHGEDWAVFEFRAEGTGYPDSEVYGRVHHFPWPDHHPPPFAIIPNVMAAMRNWIRGLEHDESVAGTQRRRVAVVHCKAGKGRSGTVSCSYLISEEGWKREAALQRFTDRRMRVGFGQGVSIPSQLRYVGYVDRWTNKLGKKYIERPIEILEVHVWGLRDGVKVTVESYVDEGKRIKAFHTFTRDEKTVIDSGRVATEKAPISNSEVRKDNEFITSPVEGANSSSSSALSLGNNYTGSFQTVILKPTSPLVLPTSDVNVDFERRNRANYTGLTMVTSIAHVWFNAWFEGGHEGHESGLFEIEWDAMDGIKGSARKGTRALEKLKVVWKYVHDPDREQVISEPKEGEPVPETEAADWKGKQPQEEAEAKHSDGVDSSRQGGAALTMGAMIEEGAESLGKELGLRKVHPASADMSRASSVKETISPRKSQELARAEQHDEDEGVKPHLDSDTEPEQDVPQELEGRQDTKAGQYMEAGLAKVATVLAKWKDKDAGEPEQKHQ
jgi:protein-tyrosine phosphatase